MNCDFLPDYPLPRITFPRAEARLARIRAVLAHRPWLRYLLYGPGVKSGLASWCVAAERRRA